MIINVNDTIIAPATAGGKSGIGIVRISGKEVKNIISKILKTVLTVRYAHFLPFFGLDGKIIDYGIVIFFSAPHSFTGEDMLELQGHGNPLILDLLIKNIILLDNIRLARPGEFSERAFLNKKIDLVQAEAIMDLIHAQSELAVQASLQSLQGFFSCAINNISLKLQTLYSTIEASINFPEDINVINLLKNIDDDLFEIIELLKNLKNKAGYGNIVREGIKIVITGAPNVGKSSLLNLLVNQNLAIVTEFSGTTRDLLRGQINIQGLNFELIDTAGICKSKNIVEKIGIELAKDMIQKSDHIFVVLDSSQPSSLNDKIISKYVKKLNKNQTITLIFNKIDLINYHACIKKYNNQYFSIFISIKCALGIDLLRKHMEGFAYFIDSSENIFIARRRHLQILNKTLLLLEEGLKDWSFFHVIELLSENLRLANKLMGEISGRFTDKELLEKIFSEFCIGK
ncbi:tRNA uridine-5-carboxymethylaminomethyl(34) synthesis GTPase MnmE [Buchnera aphidicola]|uniref:tRNA uridine-5-carboxymethylaminomethyl(34) synthesis GTPase MnmE n=1 Tax=Buchnera aphidicola TaxID=9 RepID=UPI000B1E814B|nr:tRNA uridine-5-carboxymethylaminomethyl(34) synthesis GTPase MnmE [Buchnera aphidicola]